MYVIKSKSSFREAVFTRYKGGLGDTIEPNKKQHQQDETSPPERVWRVGKDDRRSVELHDWLWTVQCFALNLPCVRCVKACAFRKPSAKPFLNASCCPFGRFLFFTRLSRLSTSMPLSRVRKPCSTRWIGHYKPQYDFNSSLLCNNWRLHLYY